MKSDWRINFKAPKFPMDQRTKELLKTCKIKPVLYQIKSKKYIKMEKKSKNQVELIEKKEIKEGFQWEDFKYDYSNTKEPKTLKSATEQGTTFDLFND